MPKINLKYGKTEFPFEYDEDRFGVLSKADDSASLTDAEINSSLDNPTNSPPLEEIVAPGETVLLVVPDATRRAAAGQIVNLLVRRLIANGTMPYEITCIFAGGIHRPVTETEAAEILTPFIAQRVKTLNHNAKDLSGLIRIGETSGKIPTEINRAVFEHDKVILIGGVSFHYFAGFTGGRKLICPGLASSRTISETHKLAFDCERKTRREGVGTGLLEGNAVHEAFTEIVEKINPAFSINTIVNLKGEAAKIFAGNWKTAHKAACDFYAEKNTIEIKEKRDVVIASCGGSPYDINMIQAHKALHTAAKACNDGGTIILLGECADGLGKDDFLAWFEAENSENLAAKLCEKYQVNGQTAWSLLKKAENFRVKIITSLGKSETEKMRLQKIFSINEALTEISSDKKGFVIPFAGKITIAESRK